MRDSAKDATVYLDDMKVAIAKIKSYVGKRGKEEFWKDGMAFDATIRNLEIIGEAAAKLPATFRAKHKTIEWRKIVGMRNRLIHRYDEVDQEIVWNVIKKDIPELDEALGKI